MGSNTSTQKQYAVNSRLVHLSFTLIMEKKRLVSEKGPETLTLGIGYLTQARVDRQRAGD